MGVQRPRPIIVFPDGLANRCLHCGVRASSVCSVVEDARLNRLCLAAVPLEVPRGQVFIEEGDDAADFFNIIEGVAKIYKLLPDGRQQVTGFPSAGHFLGLAVHQTDGAIPRKVYAFTAQAIEPLRLCRFPRSQLRGLISDFPQFERKLLEIACTELAHAQDQMLLLGRKTARERVASFLLTQLGHLPPCGQQDRLRLPMTRGEIADFLGLTIETVSRVLSRLKAEGAISLPVSDQVYVLHRNWLTQAAGGGHWDDQV